MEWASSFKFSESRCLGDFPIGFSCSFGLILPHHAHNYAMCQWWASPLRQRTPGAAPGNWA